MGRTLVRARGVQGEHRRSARSSGAARPYNALLQGAPVRVCVALAGCVLAASVGVVSSRPELVRAEDAVKQVPQGTTILSRMLAEGQSFQVRAGAAAVMGQRRDGERRPELEGALGDTHPSVRAAAANALGRIGSTQSLPPLRGATRDRVREVATTAQEAIHTIQVHTPDEAALALESESAKPRFGLMVGDMVSQSAFLRPEVSHALEVAVQRQLRGVPGVIVFEPERALELEAAAERGLSVFRLDGAVTRLSAETTEEGHLAMHCEVALLVVDRPTGSLRTLFKGAARALEVPKGDLEEQRLGIAQRVVAGAVRSALRNADSALAVAVR